MSLFTNWFAQTGWTEIAWLTVGFLAQALFSARFLVQWIASERVRKSIVPEAFWYFSAGGGAMLLAYAIWRQDPVFILGQAFGLVVYARNIYFIWTERQAENRAEP
ncbi:lipid-A-disaccharide synthase N-terminal domain-containing protein [uncultured Limimaricola sp.]|uniref:lipid-A-disaccharide synthase N-terminal domain-containing protein n=1 Tax=uncultured Limimaricola sp. TaxID=2211667 RepID=UPI0030F5C724